MVIQDTSRSIQLATAPNEALQEVFTIIGSVSEATYRQTNLPFCDLFFRVFSPSITDFPCYDLLSFPGSFHDPHLAGVHLVSKLGS